MNKEEYINTVISYMVDKTQIPLIQREIVDHILDRMDYYRHCGYSEETSEQKALEHMGDARELGIKMNYLYDYKKLNTVSLIGIILLGINVIAGVLIYVIQNYAYMSFDDSFINFGKYAVNWITTLIVVLLYFIDIKTMNYKHLIATGVLGLLFYARSIYIVIFSSYYSDVSYVVEILVEMLDILSNKMYSSVAFGVSVTLIFAGIISAILSFGYGLYVKSIIDGKAKTSLNRAYERFAYIPLALCGACFVILLVLIVMILKGVFINA